MILMSTFTSIHDVAKRWFVPRFLILDPFENSTVVGKLRTPMLIVHGSEDTLIPKSHAEELARIASNARLVLDGGNHNTCPQSWPDFFREVRTFLEDARVLR
jgi:fermentation-respiration switch protein FrsA (DUF1100 family)